jgi:multidrug efflux pump subunit AcrA (membrane-fusion protein)
MAGAQAKEAVARIDASRADTARTYVRAPFDGIVAEVNGEVGEFLTPSPPGIQTLPAVDLIDDSCLYVSAPIDEVDAAQLQVGMAGRITLDAYRGKHFAGKLRRIAPYVLAVEKQARTVEVEVEFDSPGATSAGGVQRGRRDHRRRARQRAADPYDGAPARQPGARARRGRHARGAENRGRALELGIYRSQIRSRAR